MHADERKPDTMSAPKTVHGGAAPRAQHWALELQRTLGNAAVSELITAQRATTDDVLSRSGNPLDTSVREDMEGRLGADFSDVRVHTDTVAQRSAAEFGARAYTSGNHIVAGAGGLDRHTLAHELIHVVQQRQGPVAGTDNGAGVKVSDPGDAFEREAEAGAHRALSGDHLGLDDGHHHDGGAGHVQRLVGLEAEIDLPVAPAGQNMFPKGDTPLADSNLPLREGESGAAYQIVTDYRDLNDEKGNYSNAEFVTGAVSVVGQNNAAGTARLKAIVDDMKAVQDAFYAKAATNPRSSLNGASLRLTLTEEGRTGTFANDLDYDDSRGDDEQGGLFVHYSVGVPLAGLSGFFDALRAENPHTDTDDQYNEDMTIPVEPQRRQARFRLFQAKEFGDRVVDRFTRSSKKRDLDVSPEYENAALRGFSELVYTQLTAMTDDDSTTQPKNWTVVLSRANLADIRATLPKRVQDFLATFDAGADEDRGDPPNVFAAVFDDLQEKSWNDEKRSYNPWEDSAKRGKLREVRFAEYANSAFKPGDPTRWNEETQQHEPLEGGPVTQQEVFGGMREIEPHGEEGAMMIPMELRTFGADTKTWNQLKGDIDKLTTWANEAYTRERELARVSSEPEQRPAGPRARLD